ESFPPVDRADEFGLLAIGGDLDVDSLLLAYRSGIFPWPIQNGLLTWFAPPRRAVLFLDEFHISKSLRRERRRKGCHVRTNTAFREVVEACADSSHRRNQRGTWINDDILEAYVALHKAGFAHSVEVYVEDRLIGGVYGVALGLMFAGESMFHRESN